MSKATHIKKHSALLLAAVTLLGMLTSCGQAAVSTAPPAPASSAPAASAPAPIETKTTNGGVASSTGYSTQIGIDILKAGGNAVDAAVATAFAIGVVEPEMSGIGGCGIMNLYLKDTKEFVILDFMESTPAKFVPGMFDPKDQKQANSGMGAAIPGQVHGLLTALEKYGTMSKEEVMTPAIELARAGYPLDENLHFYIGMSYDRIIKNTELTSIYTNDSIPMSVGDKITNPNLANTLEMISKGGIDEYYRGDLAKKIVEGLNKDGNPISMEDMASYTTIERKPLTTSYYGYNIVSPPPPASGGMWLQEGLNILEEKGVKDMKVNSTDYVHMVTDATRLGIMDGLTYIGDPAFYKLPDNEVVSKEYAKKRAAEISADKAVDAKPGDLPVEKLISTAPPSTDTSHISVMDKAGNIVSLTTTNGNLFGCATAIDGLGFTFNSHMMNLEHDPAKSDSPDYVMPGKRVRTTIAPTIVTKDGEPILAIGSPGSFAIPPAITLVLNNHLLYGMEIQEAIDFPRATATEMGKPIIYAEKNAITPESEAELVKMGYEIKPSEDMITSGCIAAVHVDNETGEFTAGADKRRGYVAQTY